MNLRVVVLLASALTVAAVGRLTSQEAAPRGVAGHVLVSAGTDGGVLLLGGQGTVEEDVSQMETLWSWNGSAWRALTSGGPHTRAMLGGAYDTHRSVLVVYGGIGAGTGTRFGDTWEWNGQTWTERLVRLPGSRDHHAMVYDEARQQVVIYGGQDFMRQYPNETWVWNGTAWSLADSTTGPGGLGHHAMAYDSRRQRVVLFGGAGATRISGDTWEWDGTRWSLVASTGPRPRSHQRMAYDPVRGVTVMFGGLSGADAAITWTWNGAVWTPHDVPGPSVRAMAAMAYDSTRQRVVLYSGTNSAGRITDLWEWDGFAWTQRLP